jgi:REP element-mobilizing transposase RayT
MLFGPMPISHRIYRPGELQFITARTYRRVPVFRSPRFCDFFVQRLEEVRQKMKCLLIGWALMPEHFHLLLKPQPADSTPLVIKGLKAVPLPARRIGSAHGPARISCTF